MTATCKQLNLSKILTGAQPIARILCTCKLRSRPKMVILNESEWTVNFSCQLTNHETWAKSNGPGDLPRTGLNCYKAIHSEAQLRQQGQVCMNSELQLSTLRCHEICLHQLNVTWDVKMLFLVFGLDICRQGDFCSSSHFISNDLFCTKCLSLVAVWCSYQLPTCFFLPSSYHHCNVIICLGPSGCWFVFHTQHARGNDHWLRTDVHGHTSIDK